MYPYVQSSTIYIKTWKHPKCPLENEWIKKMWYTYTIEYLLFLVSKFCLTLCNPMDCSPPGSSVHGISQARIHEWVAISFSRRPSQPRDQPHDSCIGRQSLTAEPPGKATMEYYSAIKRDEIWVICTGSFPEMQMDLQSVTHSEVSQKEKNKYHILTHVCGIWGFPGATRGKEPTCQCRTHYRYGLDSWAGEDHLEEGIATHSCFWLENTMDRGTREATVHKVTKSQTWLKQLSMHAHVESKKEWYRWTLQGRNRDADIGNRHVNMGRRGG